MDTVRVNGEAIAEGSVVVEINTSLLKEVKASVSSGKAI